MVTSLVWLAGGETRFVLVMQSLFRVLDEVVPRSASFEWKR